MPAQPTWFHRLDEILSELRGMEASHLDRLAVQNLFQVRERRARQIMAGLPGLQFGNAFGVERAALIQRLENLAAGDRFQWEVSRRKRLAADLENTRRNLAARQVRIEVPAQDAGVPGLAAGIELRAGELRIEFSNSEDLAAKLFQLSQAMANDWAAFEKAIRP